MSKPTFAIAGLQLELPNANNLETLEQEIRLVRTRFPWLDMVMLGELSAFGPSTEHAQPFPGPAEELFCRVARDTGLWLLPGSMFERRNDAVYNTASVINPAGEVVARYRKMFPFRPYERGVTSGDEFVVFDVPEVGRFGVSICYDSWFPETTRTLAWLGAEVILHPTMTNTIDRDVEVAIARASAATNQCYFIDINVAGRLGVGRSCVCGPGGELIHEAGSGREIIPVELDLAYVRRCRERGWHGLGQVLKSFRDSEFEFPPYVKGHAASPTLASLGELQRPERVTSVAPRPADK